MRNKFSITRLQSIPSAGGSMIAVCAVDELPPGQVRRLASEPPVSVFHTMDGQFYAIDDTCTHQDASLADGWLEGCLIECPLHASCFDLRTGEVDALPAKRGVRTHQVRVHEGMLYLTLSTAQPNLPPGVRVRSASPNASPSAGVDA
jgi:3-phenylpropionate/trans-cinnamate dioxygenase ferredoxin subunit